MKSTKPKAKKRPASNKRSAGVRKPSSRAGVATSVVSPSPPTSSSVGPIAPKTSSASEASESGKASKRCTLCKVDKPLDGFFLDLRTGKPRGRCRGCHGHWARQNPERQEASRIRWLQKNPDYVQPRPTNRDATLQRYYEQNKWRWTVNTRARQAAEIKATPGWADPVLIAEAYQLAAKRTALTGFAWEVDHVVPLRGKDVCGLHVVHNLRVVPRALNRAKGNQWSGEVGTSW
jgi:hypothetical protein